jgi:unconventional prefoldin RPB5 interactor 1
MEVSASSVDNVESLRQTLETNIAKLRKALSYWQTWEAEHEGFKEELQSLSKDASPKAMVDAGLGLEGEVVNERGMLGKAS